MHNISLHQHKRKRATLQKYPHPDKKIRRIDQLVSAVAILFPLTTIPQIIEIWVHQKIEGVSLLTWCLFLFFQIILVFYALVHKDKRLILMWSLWVLAEIIIITGILLFR